MIITAFESEQNVCRKNRKELNSKMATARCILRYLESPLSFVLLRTTLADSVRLLIVEMLLHKTVHKGLINSYFTNKCSNFIKLFTHMKLQHIMTN